MTNTSTNQEAMSAKPTTQNKSPENSDTPDGASPIGIKPITVTSVPESIGADVVLKAAAAAANRYTPFCILTTLIQVSQMVSSTSRPIKRINTLKHITTIFLPFTT